MAVTDFWLEQAVDFVRQLKSQCERCPLCGAVSCGAKHANWHEAVQKKLDAVEAKFTEIDNNFAATQTAIQNLRSRMTAAENEITSLKTRVTALGG